MGKQVFPCKIRNLFKEGQTDNFSLLFIFQLLLQLIFIDQIIISKNEKFLEPPSYTLGIDKDMRPLNFLLENWLCSTFVWSIFKYNQYFLQCSAIKWTYFPIFVYYFKNSKSLEPSCSTLWIDRDMRSPSFL